MTSQKDILKTKLEKLIQEGILMYGQSIVYSSVGDYLKGQQYEQWISNAQLLLNAFFNDNPLKVKFDNAASRAVGNGESYFETMMGVLNALKGNLDIVYGIDANDLFKGKKFDKIFISHSSGDKDYVEPIIQLLNDIGLPKKSEKIFCSSFEGYNIPLGEKIYDYLQNQFNQNILVLFVLSRNYYDSVPCLNEMGATWILSRSYQTILLPYFEFENIEGAIDPTKICFRISDSEKLNSFKDIIIENFGLDQIDGSIWKRDRKKFEETIETLTKRDRYSNLLTRIDISRIKPISSNELQFDLRFINKGEVPVDFSDVQIELTDSDGNQIVIDVGTEFLDGKTIYGGENRREVLISSYTSTEYNFRNQKTWNVTSSSLAAY